MGGKLASRGRNGSLSCGYFLALRHGLVDALMNISSSAVCRQSGCTYRQLDYWIRRGWIEATASGSGSGYQREYSSKTADQIAKATELMAVGFTPELALSIAKRVIETGAPVVVGDRLLTVWAPRA